MGQITPNANRISAPVKTPDPMRGLLRIALILTAVVGLLLGLSALAGFTEAGLTEMALAFFVGAIALPLWAVIATVRLFRLARRLVRSIRATKAADKQT